MSGNRSIESHALPSAPAVDHDSVATAAPRADPSPPFLSEREELESATAAPGATTVVGLALDSSETDGASPSERGPPGTSNSPERNAGFGSSTRARGSTSVGESLPRPFPKNGDLEHGLETEVLPPYERDVANMPGTRVGSSIPVSSEPPPVETGKSKTSAPTQRKGARGAVLVEDRDLHDGLMTTTTTKDSTAHTGNTSLVHGGGHGADVVAAVGAIAHADDAGLRQTPVSSLPSKDRPNRRYSADALDVVEAVVEAGHQLASNSAIPGICEAARLVSILVRLVTDYRDGSSEVEWRVKRCRSIIFMLERAGEVLAKVRRPATIA